VYTNLAGSKGKERENCIFSTFEKNFLRHWAKFKSMSKTWNFFRKYPEKAVDKAFLCAKFLDIDLGRKISEQYSVIKF